MIYLNKPYVLVEWDDEAKYVKIEWKGFADGAEWREAHDKIVQALSEHSGNKMLGDARGMKAVAPEDQAWLNKDWGPRAGAAGLKHSAIVLPKSAVAQMSLQRIIGGSPHPQPGSPSSEGTGYFETVEEAKKWLRSAR